ncbi:MAG: hypothetical protein AAGE80_11825 [Pseudomonadota bacterium]
MSLRSAAAGAIISLSLATPSLADDIAALQSSIASFSEAMMEQDYERIVDVVPRRVLEMMAGYANTDPETLRSAMIQQTRDVVASTEVLEFSIDATALSLQSTENGVSYAFLPTETLVMIPGTGKVRSETSTLAVFDDERWYFASIDSDQQATVIREAYPGFKAIDFPGGSSKVVE